MIVELENGGNVQNVTKNGSGSDAKIDYTVTLKNPVDHKEAGVEDVLDLLGDVVVLGKDGSRLGIENKTLVQIDDDSPVAKPIVHKIQVQKDTFILSNLKAGFSEIVFYKNEANKTDQAIHVKDNQDEDDLIELISWTSPKSKAEGFKPAAYHADEVDGYNVPGGKDITKDFGKLFEIGTFTHENNPVNYTIQTLDRASLHINFKLEINGVEQLISTQYDMVHTETNNFDKVDNGSSDKLYKFNDLVIIPNTHQLVSVGGQQYWLDITFVQKLVDKEGNPIDPTSNPRNDFVNSEHGYSQEYIAAYQAEQALRMKNAGVSEDNWSDADLAKLIEIQQIYSNINSVRLKGYQMSDSVDNDGDGLADATMLGFNVGNMQTASAKIRPIGYRLQKDVKFYDLDHDGKFDAIDTNGDGRADYFDRDHDGFIDGQDTDGDGIADRVTDVTGVLIAAKAEYSVFDDANGYRYLMLPKGSSERNSANGPVVAEDAGANGHIYRDIFSFQTNTRVDFYDTNKDGVIDAIDTNRDGVIDYKDESGRIAYDYSPALDEENTQIIDTVEHIDNHFGIKARLTPAKPMPKVDNSIVIQDALEVGSDSENVTVEWSYGDKTFTGEKDFSDVNGINYGKFIGNADGSYQFIVSDELSAQMTEGKKVDALKIDFKYIDSDGDSAGQTLTFNFEEHDMKSIGADGVHMSKGADSNDFLIGSVYADELHGGNGADILVGYGVVNGNTSSNHDSLYGEAGNDILYFDSNTYIDGGTGVNARGEAYEDTLYLNGYSTDLSGHENTKIDFSAISSMIHHIEVIDMVDPTQTIAKNQVKFAQELTISADQVLDLSDTDQLRIEGDNQDIVHLGGFKLTKTEGDYHQYTADNGASVQINVSIDEHNIYLF